jgi:hypothetical protein
MSLRIAILLMALPVAALAQGAAPQAATLPPPGTQETTVEGRVLEPVRGPGGTVEGAVLGDGTQLRVPAASAAQVAPLLQPGAEVTVEGYTRNTPAGPVMTVEAIGGSPDAMIPLTPTPAQPLPAASARLPAGGTPSTP